VPYLLAAGGVRRPIDQEVTAMFSQRSLATGVSALTVLVGCLLVTRSALAQTYLPAIPGSLDDTQRIEQALDACNAPEKACTVRLGPGVFHVGLIVVEDFHGSFVGSGIGKTVVKAKPGIEAHFDLLQPHSKTNRMPNLLSFLSGNFSIADMSIRVEGFRPLLAYQFLPGFPDTYFMNTILAITQRPGGAAPHVSIERVEIAGADGDAASFFGFNGLPAGLGVNTNGVLFFGGFFFNPILTGGSLVVRDSVMKRGVNGFFTLRTADSSVRFVNNHVTESIGGVGAYLASRSMIAFRENTIESWQHGVSFLQTPFFDFEGWGPPEASRFVASGNTIRTSQIMDVPSAGIVATDEYTTIPGEVPRLDGTVSDNRVISTGGNWTSERYGIWLNKTVGTKVMNNQLLGSGDVALAVDESQACRLLFNSMLRFEASRAQIMLSARTRDCLVLGVHPSVTIVNEGENNVIKASEGRQR